MKSELLVSPSPHLRKKESVSRIMWLVSLSLLPSGIAGVWIFGWQALWVVITAILSAVLAEGLIQALAKKRVAISDGSAFLTGLLLAYNLPPNVPLWLPAAGSFFAVAVGKLIFGGLGQNIFNPALAGRAFLMASWPKHMTTFTPAPIGKVTLFFPQLVRGFIQPLNYDGVTSATPLAALKEGKLIEHISYLDLFLGRRAGCIGEACIVLLLLGALFLLIRGYISWHIPVAYMATTGLLVYIFGGQGLFRGDWLFHLLSGGLVLGAFFMATDYVTSPLTRQGQVIFGIGCGVLTAVIRLYGGYPEGASYAILMMNAATPIIDRYTKNRVYGTTAYRKL